MLGRVFNGIGTARDGGPGIIPEAVLDIAGMPSNPSAPTIRKTGASATAIDQEESVAVMQEKYEICCGIFHGCDWSDWEDPQAVLHSYRLPRAS